MRTLVSFALLALALAVPATAAAPADAAEPAPELALLDPTEPVEVAATCPAGSQTLHVVWDPYFYGDAACEQDCKNYCASKRAGYLKHSFSPRGASCSCTCCQF